MKHSFIFHIVKDYVRKGADHLKAYQTTEKVPTRFCYLVPLGLPLAIPLPLFPFAPPCATPPPLPPPPPLSSRNRISPPPPRLLKTELGRGTGAGVANLEGAREDGGFSTNDVSVVMNVSSPNSGREEEAAVG